MPSFQHVDTVNSVNYSHGLLSLADVPSYYVSSLSFLVRYGTSLQTDPGSEHRLVLEICHPRCQMQSSDRGPTYNMARTQIPSDDLSHVRRCPLSHLPVAPVWSSCLPLARVALVVVPRRLL